MRRIFNISILLLMFLLLSPVYAQDDNLLQNGELDSLVGWLTFDYQEGLAGDVTAVEPIYQSVTGREGGIAQAWSTESGTTFAGLYQVVEVEKGSTYRLDVWVNGSSSERLDEVVNPAWLRQAVGIDPMGGTDPLADTVVWSPAAQFETWGELSVESVALSEQMTVYLTGYPNKDAFNSISYDNAVLQKLSDPFPLRSVSYQESDVCQDPLVVGLVDSCGTGPGQQGFTTLPYSPPVSPKNTNALWPILMMAIGLFFIFRAWQIRRSL